MPLRFSDPAFEEVVEGSLLSFACSPAIEEPAFRGLRIAAPERVRYSPGESDPITGAFAPVLVCGTYRLAYDTLGLEGDFVESIVLVAVDVARRETFRGTMVTIENAIGFEDEPSDAGEGTSGIAGDSKPKPRAENFAGDVITGYFNPNLAVVLDLPERPAEYEVSASLGPYRSNRVEIAIRASAELAPDGWG